MSYDNEKFDASRLKPVRRRETGHRVSIFHSLFLALALLCSVLLLAGCDSSGDKVSGETDTSQRLNFGPVYSANSLKDPLIRKTVQSAPDKGKIVSAEIRGFLADWVIRDPDGSSGIVEFVVMKDGSVYRLGTFGRPSAAFSRPAPKRLGPEPSREARARAEALAAAHDVVVKLHPRFASADPAVYGYLVRIHYKDDSHDDLWIDPSDGQGAPVAGAGFGGPIYLTDAITDPFVAQAFSRTEVTGAPAVSIQIGGYLVNWVLGSEADQQTLEYIVTKTGLLYKVRDRESSAGAVQPGGSSPARVSQIEVQARKKALARAQQQVAQINPDFGGVEPVLQKYLLSIRLTEGSNLEVFIGTDGAVEIQPRSPMLEPVGQLF